MKKTEKLQSNSVDIFLNRLDFKNMWEVVINIKI